MSVSKNVIIMWAGTHAGIPSGFTRETTLDEKFLKGAAAGIDPNTTGGNATHTHTSPAHSHSVVDHGHYIETNYVDHTDCIDKTTGGSGTGNGGHRHVGTVYGTSGSTSSVAATYGAVSNNPPYLELIFMKSLSYKAVPNSGLIFWAGASLPSGFAAYAAAADKFIKGAPSGNDAGSTGGSSTNTHDITHGHTASHSHSYSVAGRQGGTQYGAGGGGGGASDWNHAHTMSLNSRSDTIANYAGSVVCDETVEPAHTKLMLVQNTSGSNKMPIGAIAMWLGALDDIPIGWYLCDGTNGTPDLRSQYVKVTSDSGQIEDTGGSNTHTHAAKSHGHSVTNPTHTHGGSVGGHPCSHNHLGGGDCVWRCGYGSTHSLSRIDNGTVSYNNANTTADSSNNEPPYRTVAFIQFAFEAGGASMLINQ